MLGKILRFPKLKLLALVGLCYGYYNREKLLIKFSERFLNPEYFNKNLTEHHSLGGDLYDYFKAASSFSAKEQPTVPVNGDQLPEVKEFQDTSHAKITVLNELIKRYDTMINDFSKSAESDQKLLALELEEEKKVLQEIESAKSELNININDMEEQCRKLNLERNQILQLIQKESESYSQLLKNTTSKIESHYDSDLKELKEQYYQDIKPFHLGDNNEVSLSKEELLKKLSDLTKIRKDFKMKETELIEAKIKQEHVDLEKKHEELKKLSQWHKKIATDYHRIKKDQYECLNKLFSIEKVIESFLKNKADEMKAKTAEYQAEIFSKINSEVRPSLMNALQKEIDEMKNIIEKATKNDKKLVVQENKEYLMNFYKMKNLDILLTIRYLLHLQANASRQNSEQNISNINIPQLLGQNLLKLQKLAKIFGDNFSENLIVKSNLSASPLTSKEDIVNEFNFIKEDVFENIFSRHKPSLFNLFYTNLLGRFSGIWLRLYRPLYNDITEKDSSVIKKMKAFGFINYYIHNGRYSKAYRYFKYLEEHKGCIAKLQRMVETMTKQELVIDLLEKHLI